jgi:hypothetical protein
LDEIADTVKQKHDAGSTDIVGMPAGTYSGWGAMGGSGPDNYKVGYSELQPGDSLHFSGNETAYGVLVIDAPNGITGEVLSYQGNPQFSGLIIIRTPTVMTGNKSVVKLTGTGSDPNSVLGGVAMLVEDQINLGKGGLISVGGNGNLRFSSTTVGKAVDAVENIRDPEVPPGVTEPAKWDQLYHKVEPISP